MNGNKVSIRANKTSGGLFEVMGKINGFGPFNFIYDPGASKVSISKTEFLALYKQNRISIDDITGSSKVGLANGEVEENLLINIRELEIGGITAFNVKAFVSLNLNAPILLGQSFFERFGKVTQNNKETLIEIEKY